MPPYKARKQRPRGRGPKRVITKVSAPLKRAIQRVINRNVETKTINCPDADTGLIPTNTVNKMYANASGVQYLVSDVYRQNLGTADSTLIRASNGNRIGDAVQALGFRMNYYFHTKNIFTLAGQNIQMPFVKLRLIVFTTRDNGTPLQYSLLYDTNFLDVATTTLHPVNRDEGYVKKVLYDKVFVINNNSDFATQAGSNPNTAALYGSCLHVDQYIKYPHKIKYIDNNSQNIVGTAEPIYIAITAEVDYSLSGFPPSDTPLVYTTGYTQAWFKDA